jgi:2-C-methyl-D-erythritol 4-phosphate cytidylyltransferase
MQRTALIVAGGSGTRMGVGIPKQFLPLSGKPVLVHTVKVFLGLPQMDAIALVLPEAHFDRWNQVAKAHLSPDEISKIHLSAGGTTRTESVEAGLETLSKLVENPAFAMVAIHDGVRPLVQPEVVEQSYELAAKVGAAVVCVPVKASLRKNTEFGSHGIDRSQYWEVQTPQTFRLGPILNCYRRRPEQVFTDDASLYEETGGKVAICPGSYENMKLTTPEDMLIAEQILKSR